MFGDPATNPKGWPVAPLATLVDASRPISYGILMPGHDQPDGISYTRVVDMKSGTVDPSTVKRTTLEIHHEYRRSILRSRDVIISIRGHVGRVALVPAELDGANITQDTARLAILGAEPEFVRDMLRMDGLQSWIKRHTKGVAVQGINLGDVKRIPIPLPPANAQRTYARVTSSIDAMRYQYTQSRTTTESDFEARLQASAAALDANAAQHAATAEALKAAQVELAALKAKNQAVPDTHDDNEAESRKYLIDVLLAESAWPVGAAAREGHDTEYEVAGMPNAQSKGFVDYVLWGEDGVPLALVEAKRTHHDAAKGHQQAKLYADCLEAKFGRRPVMCLTTATNTGCGMTQRPRAGA